MPESSTHVALVQSIVQFAIREFGALADIAVREDAVRPIRHEKPPRIDRYVPDVFVTDVPTTRTLIGEAKTLKDIETDHTRRQVSTFLTYLSTTPGGIFVLSVPLQGRATAQRLLRELGRQLTSSTTRTVVLDPSITHHWQTRDAKS